MNEERDPLGSPTTGLVLTGGGARAAYQVGALRALAEILDDKSPFQILAGASAGAINSTGLAIHGDDFRAGVAHLLATWRSLLPDQVYRTDVGSLFSIGASWMRQLSSGGVFGAPSVNALLDTTPLRRLLERALPTRRIRQHIESGHLRGVAVTATSYHTGTAMSFFDGADDIAPWVRSSRLGTREPLTVSHVLASSAIPMFFPPVDIDGAWFGDGCVRLSAPLSPAIHMGAQRLVAIGIRYARTPQETNALNAASRLGRSIAPVPTPASRWRPSITGITGPRPRPTVSEISGVLLNAIFLDSLDSDVERMERINATLSLLTEEQHQRMRYPLRSIPLLVLRPSRDLGSLAIEQYRRFPRTLRHLLRGIGASGESGWDLVSYLAFEPAYIERLMELGYDDTIVRRREVERFFS
ncbi:MAG: Patatin [Myxococcaceae bacterium]|nr:Patatin [Myxococcaceae bacterium]